MGKYIVFNKNNLKYIDTLFTSLKYNKEVEIKNNLNGLDASKDIVLLIDVKMLYLALKLGFQNVYYFNIEQMSIPLDYKLNKNLIGMANLNNRNIHNQYFKIARNPEFKNKFKVIDYSLENKYIWETEFNTIVSGIIQPVYFLELEIELELKNSNSYKEKKNLDYISLINHDYRPEFIKNNLPRIGNNIQNFLGYFFNDRRNVLKRSKILINIHCGNNYRIGELFRIYEALAHKVIIISQHCFKNELIELQDFIIFVNDEDMENKCLEVLENYDKYYNLFFGGDNLSRLNETILKISNDNNNTITNL